MSTFQHPSYIQPCSYETKKMTECHRLEGSGTDINYVEFGTQNFSAIDYYQHLKIH